MAYRIKSVAALTGLTTSTLRAWERRYGLLAPERSRGGYRLYTDNDVARLTRIKSLLDNGFKVSEAIALVEREAPPLAPADSSSESLDRIRADMLEALLQMDRPRASLISQRLASLPFERRIDEILLPVLRDVGQCWLNGDANVAQEHFASAFVREKLTGMLSELDAGPTSGPEAVCVGLPHEHHEIGLLALGVHLALRGWRVTYLGADLPLEDLREALEMRPPRLLCTAMVQMCSGPQCEEMMRNLRAAVPADTVVVVGGSGIPASLDDLRLPNLHMIRDLGAVLQSPLLDSNHA